MKINKAIILAAGYGTRFLPITKTIQKEMLPLLQRPWIDYVVDDCIKAGVTDIIFVVKEQDTQIRHYYSEDGYTKRYLERMNKSDKYIQIADLHTKARFTFVEQTEQDKYGTAVPVLLAKKHVINEDAFLVIGGDDYFYNSDGTSEVANMIDTFNKSNASGLVTCINVPKSLIGKYGIADYREEDGYKFLIKQVEKPEPDEINSTLATISKYIFTPKLYDYLEGQELDKKSGELYITTAYAKYAQDYNVVLHSPTGRYLDSGYLLGWLKSNLTMAKEDPELWKEVKDFINAI